MMEKVLVSLDKLEIDKRITCFVNVFITLAGWREAMFSLIPESKNFKNAKLFNVLRQIN